MQEVGALQTTVNDEACVKRSDGYLVVTPVLQTQSHLILDIVPQCQTGVQLMRQPYMYGPCLYVGSTWFTGYMSNAWLWLEKSDTFLEQGLYKVTWVYLKQNYPLYWSPTLSPLINSSF